MSDEPQSDPLVSDEAGCQFPTGPNGEVCGDQIARSGAPGRPSRYCGNPDHTRAKAFAARRAFERVPVGGGLPEWSRVEPGVPERPVTDGRTSLGALLSQFEDTAARAQQVAAEQQAQLGAILERATQVIRTVSDPDAAGYEVEQIQRAMSVTVAEAQTAQAQAEQEARTAKKKADREAELRAQADEAAEQALQDLDTVRAQTAETIARITTELERVQSEAAKAVTAAQAGAELHRRQAIEDRDRVLAERETDMRRRIERAQAEAAELVAAAQAQAQTKIEVAEQHAAELTAAAQRAVEQAKTEASTLVTAAQAELVEMTTAKTRAEADQGAAERRAQEDRATAERLRAELDQQRTDYHQELTELREEIRAEREGMRNERTANAEQLAIVLATVQAVTVHPEPETPTGDRAGRRRTKGEQQ